MLLLPLYELEWPFGKDGDLIIGSGQTVTLNPGDVKDYKRVEIFGTLRINSGSQLVTIGCATDFIIHSGGQIDAENNGSIGNSTTKTTPDGYGRLLGETVNAGFSQRSGGKGGEEFSTGGVQNSGNGGGGAAGVTGGGGNRAGGNATTTRGGHGGDTGRVGQAIIGGGGAGAPVYGNNGNNAPGTGGGGGGGSRGLHGNNLYIRVKRDFTNNGSIRIFGRNGGKGGNGRSGGNVGPGGNGGGGGAGGNGGSLFVRYRRNLVQGSINANPGFGGGGGSQGGSICCTGGDPGNSGQSGIGPIPDFTTYTTNH